MRGHIDIETASDTRLVLAYVSARLLFALQPAATPLLPPSVLSNWRGLCLRHGGLTALAVPRAEDHVALREVRDEAPADLPADALVRAGHQHTLQVRGTRVYLKNNGGRGCDVNTLKYTTRYLKHLDTRKVTTFAAPASPSHFRMPHL